MKAGHKEENTLLTNEELMEAYQLGNCDAFDELYQRLAPRTYAYLRSRLNTKPETDDVFQQVFLKFHASRGHYDAHYTVMPWLYAICRSVLTDYFRQAARDKRTIAAQSAFAASETVASPLKDGSILDNAPLPLKQLDLLRLRFEQDMSFAEIAQRLGTTPVNARQLVSRAVRRVAGLLKARENNG